MSSRCLPNKISGSVLVVEKHSSTLGKPSFKKKRNFMKLFHKRGGGDQPDFISLIQKCYTPKKARKNQNKDFIKAVRGGGGSPFYEKFS